MGRRSDHSREALHELALDAAEKLASSGGLSAITARAVASEIGYTAGTLYNVFGNLDGLILALNFRTLGRLEQDLRETDLPTGQVRRDLLALLDIYADHVSNAPRLWALLIDHSLPEGQSAPDWYQARIAALLGRVEAILRPLFEPDDGPQSASQSAPQSARVLWLSVHHLLAAGSTGTLSAIDAAEGRILARDLVETYFNGLYAARGKRPDSNT